MTKYSVKNICLGIGIGLILASIANINVTPTRLTVEEIKREAAQHNLIVMDPKDLIQKQPEEKVPEQTPPAAEQPKTTSENQVVIVNIESGSTSDTIAQLLFDKKLITSKKDFLDRLAEMKKESKLQIGTFKITAGSSIDKIIETITSLPK